MAELLLRSIANPNARSNSGVSSLMWACNNGDHEVAPRAA